MKKRILSGIQPSGELHLGNYFGMMSRMIEYQEKNDLFCCIVNLHALTTIDDKSILSKNTVNAAIDFIALGLDPKKTTFWIQGDVPQVCQSSWLFSNITNMGLLDRSTSYKDKIAKGLKPNVGLYSYPILMASDILLYGAHTVPVGKDQKQHIEIARDIAIRFNKIYGETFVLPEPSIEEDNRLIPGIDGNKMSKSYQNFIPIFGSEKFIRKRFMSIITDSAGINEPKDTDSPLFKLYSLFLDKNEIDKLKERFLAPGMRYGDVKKELFEKFWLHFEPFRKKRDYLSNHKDFVFSSLKEGAEKATIVADVYLGKMREAMGLNYG